jgi:peroxiredoxin Q/BCP
MAFRLNGRGNVRSPFLMGSLIPLKPMKRPEWLAEFWDPVKPKRRAFMLKVGDRAPKFSAVDQNGKTQRLADYAGSSVVLYFYPRDMTPGCTVEACGFRDGFSAIKKKGAAVLGVSKDTAASHEKFAATYKLPFPLLADESGKILEDYGAWGEKSMYGKKYMGILRITYVIGPTGRIVAVFPKVKPATHADEVLAVL